MAEAGGSVVHTVFGDALSSLPADAPKLVATIFYKSADTVHTPPHLDDTNDHLHGPYVTQLCHTTFLHVMEELLGPVCKQTSMSSAYRRLDREEHPRVVEVTVSPLPDSEVVSLETLRKHEKIGRFEREWNVEVVMQRESVFRRHKRLAVFDMDSTLIQQEVIDEIARFIGVEKEVSVWPANLSVLL